MWNMYSQQWFSTLNPHQVVIFNLGQLNTNHERAITRGHTWLPEIIRHFWELMPYEEICCSYIAIQVQEWSLGVNITQCLHDTIGWCTSDFSCLTFNSVTNVSDNMWGSEIDYFLYSSSLPGTAGHGPRIALLMERIYQVLYRLGGLLAHKVVPIIAHDHMVQILRSYS